MEAHFVDRIRDKIPPQANVLTVCGSSDASLETLDRLRSAGIGVHHGDAFAGGFSDFVLAAQADAFLSDVFAAS